VVRRVADGDPGSDLSTAYTRLADSAVVDLIRRMRATAVMAVAPATPTVVAVGRYGAREALPGEELELLFLVPDEARPRAAAEAAMAQLTSGLHALGFDLRGRTATLGEQVASELTQPLLSARGSKRRLSQFPGEASCNQEETGGLEQGLDDEALAVVAQRQASVLQDPGVAALDRPAALAQA
jgi:hypothetical protein